MSWRMSFAEIISELPNLTREQRAALLERLAALDQGLWVDVTIPENERKEVDWRLAEARAGGVAWSNWDEAKTRITAKLNPG